jgi:hypothetical protein
MEAMYCNPFDLSFVRERYVAVGWRRFAKKWITGPEGMRQVSSAARSGFGAAVSSTSLDLDPEDYSEMTISLSYGAQRWRNVAWGVNLRYLRVSSDLEEVAGSGYAMDAGVLWLLPGEIRLGARAENLWGRFSWDFGSDEDLARRLELGAAAPLLGRVLGTFQLTVGDEETKLQAAGLGLEWELVRGVLTLRGGLKRSNRAVSWENSPRAGLGLRVRGITLDYSVNDEGSFLKETHRWALSIPL